MKKVFFLGLMLAASFAGLAQTGTSADYAGVFKLDENPYVKSIAISIKEGKVMLTAEGFPDAELTPGKQADQYDLASMSAVVSFVREAGIVKGIKIEAQGQVLAGKKEGGASLADYTATFKMADNEYVKKIVVAIKDGSLQLSTDANPTEGAVLKAGKTADVFTTTIQGYDADIIFSRTSGKVANIKLSVAGGQVVLTGDRE
jgi:hypothetical protein